MFEGEGWGKVKRLGTGIVAQVRSAVVAGMDTAVGIGRGSGDVDVDADVDVDPEREDDGRYWNMLFGDARLEAAIDDADADVDKVVEGATDAKRGGRRWCICCMCACCCCCCCW